MIIAAIIIVVIIIGGILVYNGLNNGILNGNGGFWDENPGPIEDANSLQFEVEITNQETITRYKLTGKNLRAEDMKIQIEFLDVDSDNIYYILNPGEQEVWTKTDNTWKDLSDDFGAQWDLWGNTWINYVNNLQNWTGTGEYTYDRPNSDFIRIYNISVDPDISDSLFQPN
jgi:hypothetical protein